MRLALFGFVRSATLAHAAVPTPVFATIIDRENGLDALGPQGAAIRGNPQLGYTGHQQMRGLHRATQDKRTHP
jgi:hypothetical protein